MKVKSFGTIVVLSVCIAMFTSCASKKEVPTPKPAEQTLPIAPTQLPENKVKENVYLENTSVGGLTKAQVVEEIRKMASRINKDPVNAKVDPSKWAVSGEGQTGKKVNEDATVKAVMDAKEGEKITLKVEETKPELTANQAKANIVEIGSYTTKILDQDENRLNNIRLASGKIDYKKIKPGETFSFNGTVGVRNENKGYEEAPIIVQTEEGPKKKDGVGGGVCQLSTTIFNAAEKAGMEITERHMHSKDIGYVPKGQDATVSYGTVDLKFKNTRNHPVMLRASMEKNTLTVKVLENRNQ